MGRETCIQGSGGKTHGKETTEKKMLNASFRNRVGGESVDWINP